MALIIVTAPTSEPVTVAEAKRHLNIDIADDDDYIASLIVSARHQVENYTQRQIMPATWKYITRDFPGSTGIIELMRGPLSTVSSNISIGYVDNTNSTNTLATTAYTVDYERVPGRIYPTYNNEWPSNVLSDHPKSVEITFVSGYANRSAVPQPIKHWIVQRVGVYYEYREEVTPDAFNRVGREYGMGLLDPYRILRFAT